MPLSLLHNQHGAAGLYDVRDSVEASNTAEEKFRPLAPSAGLPNQGAMWPLWGPRAPSIHVLLVSSVPSQLSYSCLGALKGTRTRALDLPTHQWPTRACRRIRQAEV